jgi:GDP-4-dehydro-6-deoxy-D-mannose reductase
MKVLVTGASGFTGRYLMEFLSHQHGVETIGLVHSEPPESIAFPRTRWYTADIRNKEHLARILSSVRPDAVIHLAGLTRGTPGTLNETNVTGTKNLLDAALAANRECRILVISSSAVYGNAGESPISENTPLLPLSEYGISKKAQEELSRSFGEAHKVAVATARPFNLAGPGQPESFVCGRIVKQVVEIERKQRTAIELWEIVSSRDLIDVRDVVRGYWALVSHPGFAGDCSGKAFNLGSGNAYPVSGIIALIEEITGEHYPVQLPATTPPVLIPSQKSDNSRITALTGWRPEISLRETLQDMLDTARKK